LFVMLAFLASVRLVVHSALAQVTNLGIAPAANQTVLFWPTTFANYVLQSTTNLASSNWVAVSNAVPMTAVIVTNASSAMFFRLYLRTITPSRLLVWRSFRWMHWGLMWMRLVMLM
jgi:hypothetical protein